MTPTAPVSDRSRPGDWLSGTPAIVYQRCHACDHAWYLPRGTCDRCGAADPHDLLASGEGLVYAVTLVSRAPSPVFREASPYLLIFVDASEGFRMMAHGAPGLRIGDAVTATFVIRAERMLPVFEAALSDRSGDHAADHGGAAADRPGKQAEAN